MKRAYMALLGIMLVATVAAPDVSGEWTQDYDCDEAFWTNNHKVDNGIYEWAAGTHPYWPNDCSLHYGPEGEGGE